MIDLKKWEKGVEGSAIVKKTEGFFAEFWVFAAKGNAMQLAIAVVLGNAFGAIITALVGNLITPLLSLTTQHVNFNTLTYIIRPEEIVANGKIIPAVVLGYGQVIQALINFFIVGLSIFGVYKLLAGAVQRFHHEEKAAEQEAAAEKLSTQEQLLTEIRDLLKQKAQQK